MSAVETKKVGNNTIELHYDEGIESPRGYDNLSTFAFFHRNYYNESNINTSDFSSLEEIREHIESRNGLNAIAVPVYLYSHSGDTISTTPFSCPWDSGQLGFAFVERSKARAEYGWKCITKQREEWLKTVIASEIDEYDKFIRGEVYYYILKDENDEIIDSCGGFIGREFAMEEAEAMLKYNVEEVA